MGCNGCNQTSGMFERVEPDSGIMAQWSQARELVEPVERPTLIDGMMRYPEGVQKPEEIDGFERTSETVFESIMPACRSRYRVVAMERNGVMTVKHTCLHPDAKHLNQYVPLAVCQGCSLRKGG